MPVSKPSPRGQPEKIITAVLDRLLKPIRQIRIDPNRLYSRNHLWLQRKNHHWRLGIDLFAARILGQVSEIIYPIYRDSLQRGTHLLWIHHANGMIVIRSPVTATALQKNQRLRDFPSLLLSDPMGEGWLVTGDFQADERPEDFIPGQLVVNWMSQEIEWLFQELKQRIMQNYEHGMGETLEDGGVFVTDIISAIGPLAHRDLVNRIVNLT